jgi:hypothetical protein
VKLFSKKVFDRASQKKAEKSKLKHLKELYQTCHNNRVIEIWFLKGCSYLDELFR